MKKYSIILLLLLAAIGSLSAQRQWTLRECINYAIENNIDIKQKVIRSQGAEIDLHSSKTERLPDLSATAGQDFNFGRSQLNDGIYQSINSSTTSFGVSTSMPVFTGFRIKHNIDVKKFDLMSAMADVEKAKDNLELNITALYLEVLFKKEILKVYEEQLLSTSQQLGKTVAMVASGKVPRSQEYDMLAQQAKDELNITVAKNDLDLSLLNLSQALNLISDENFDVVIPSFRKNKVEADEIMLMSPREIYIAALSTKPHVKVAEYDLQSKKSGVGVAKAAYFPSLSLSAGYSTSYNSKGGDSFTRQLKNFGREYIGLTLSVPIFNRFHTRNQVRSAKLNVEYSELNLESVKQALFKEIQQAYQQAISAQSKYKSTDKALMAAQEAYDYALLRYDVGQFTVFEFNDAQVKLYSSKSEMIQSKYDFIFKTKILDFYRGVEISID